MDSENKNTEISTNISVTYNAVRSYIITAQRQLYSAIDSAMVTAYWNIGRQLYEACGNNDRAAYGKQLLQHLSDKLTAEFGKGFDVRNLQMMRKFYLTFPNTNALRSQLSWTHYRLLMKVADEKARNYYLEETVKSAWSSRQLERQINSSFQTTLSAMTGGALCSACLLVIQ